MNDSNAAPEQAVRSSADPSTTTKVASAAHSAVDTAAANLEKAEIALREARIAAGQSADEAAQRAQLYSDQALESARRYIHENPVRSVGIAFATGYLISVLMKR